MKLPKVLVDQMRRIITRWKNQTCRIESYYVGRNVQFGVNCFVGRNAQINNGVHIGDYSYVNEGSIIRSGTIGKFCSIAYYCQIGMAEHPTNYISTSPFTYGKGNIFGLEQCRWDDYKEPPVIGNDVWIGSNAIVLQGVRIGDGAIIAAGSVVTKDVAPYSIVGGVPARFIRKRFDEDIVTALLNIKWWDIPHEQLTALGNTFSKGEHGPAELAKLFDT